MGLKSSLEGLSERQVEILVQDQIIPILNKKNQYKNLPIQTNIQSGSGFDDPTPSTPEMPLRVHDGAIASIAAGNPIVPTMSLTTAETIIKQTEVAAASGDLFMTGKDFRNK